MRIQKKGKTTRLKESGVGAEGEAVTSIMSKKLHLLEGLVLDTVLIDTTFTCSRFPTCKIMVFHNPFLKGKWYQQN